MRETFLHQPRAEEISLELARELQAIGAAAFVGALPSRTPEEISNVFDPDNPEMVSEKMKVYTDFANQNGLIIARRLDDGRAVGFGLTKEQVSGSVLEKIHKKLFMPSKVYALIQLVVVEPGMQGRGIGRSIAERALAVNRQNRTPSAYVLEENRAMLEGITKYGFERTGTLDPDETYFGEGARPATLVRFAAPEGIASVRAKLIA